MQESAPAFQHPRVLRFFLQLAPRGNYGLVVLCASAIGTVAGGAGHSFVLGCFTDSLTVDLNLPRSVVARCFMLAIFVSSLYAQIVGAAADRLGSGTLVLFAALPYTIAITSISAANGVVSLQAAVLAVRMLGPETIDFACRHAVTQWWVRRRGMALGALQLVSASMSILPAFISMTMDILGWRRTLQWMGILMGGISIAISSLLLRSPEHYGLLPDTGEPAQPGAGISAQTGAGSSGLSQARERERVTLTTQLAPVELVVPTPEPQVAVREALTARGFWLMATYYLLCGGAWNAINFHLSAILAEQAVEDLDDTTARSLVYLPLAATSAVSAMVAGALIDRLSTARKQLTLIAPALMMGASLAALGSGVVGRRSHLVALGLGLGCYQALDKVIPPVVSGALFGRCNSGRIEAMFLIMRQASGALGVQALGTAKDATGSTEVLLKLVAFALVMLTVLIIAFAPGKALERSKSD